MDNRKINESVEHDKRQSDRRNPVFNYCAFEFARSYRIYRYRNAMLGLWFVTAVMVYGHYSGVVL